MRRLGLSEAATYNRIAAARFGRRYPVVFERIAAGRLHLTAVRMLAPHLTDENHAELLKAAAGRSKRELEELLAERFPKPEAPTVVRKLPANNSPRGELSGGATASGAVAIGRVGSEAPEPAAAHGSALWPAPTPPAAKPSRQRDRLEPLSPSRYKVQFTATAELAKKIEEARELASHHVGDNDLAALLEKALDLFIASEKKRRFAATSKPRPRKRPVTPKSRHVPAEVRRAVWERDQGRCSYVDNRGRRCEA